MRILHIACLLLIFIQPAYAHQKPQNFNKDVRSWLLTHPEILLEMAAILDDKRNDAEKEADYNHVQEDFDALFSNSNDGRFGNIDNATINIVEFIDYNCGYCRQQSHLLKQLLTENTHIQLIVKEFPILNSGSRTAAYAALAVQKMYGNTAYKRFHDLLLSNNGLLDENTINSVLEQGEFDVTLVIEEAKSAEINQTIDANFALAEKLNIQGTPAFIFDNGQIMRGFLDSQQLSNIIEQY